MTKNDDLSEEILKEKDKKSQDDEDDKKDEDDDQNFIKKDDVKETLFKRIKKELSDVKKILEGILPEGNQQRNLDRETGGVEAEADKGISEEDAWDKRSEQIAQMNDEIESSNDPSGSSLKQSLIHQNKQKKKNEKANLEAAKDSFENMGYVQRLKNLRQDRTSADGKDNNSGGRGM